MRPNVLHAATARMLTAMLVISSLLVGAGAARASLYPPLIPVADATVVGPIAATATPGDASHDYPWFATDVDLAAYGYVEEEYFLEGVAMRYQQGLVPQDTRPYRTRIVVRRPASADAFAGTALLEWFNVTNNADMENTWFQVHDFVLRSGWAWIGVSAQRVGVNALRNWSPTRYGTLDVSARSGGRETLTDDSLAFDIFSQAAQAVRSPKGTSPLGSLAAPNVVIATGHSQSAMKLDLYVNGVQPLTHTFDAFAIHGSVYGPLRPDLEVPTWKVLSEYDVTGFGEAALRRPDVDNYRSWEVAGTSHVDKRTLARAALERRDTGVALEDSLACGHPVGTTVPFDYAISAGLSQLDRWVRTGVPMTTAPWLVTGPANSTAQRDADGNILGGLRLPQMDAPIYLSTGTNSGPEPCPRWGYTQSFSDARLRELYATHEAYVTAVVDASERAVASGWLLRVDADQTIADAREADVPPGWRTAEAASATGGGWIAAGGGKINFGFKVQLDADGYAGDLSLNDRGVAKVAIDTVISLGAVHEPCGGIAESARALEITGTGTFNGGAATFRACVEDNARSGSTGVRDRFYLECTSGCTYSTAARSDGSLGAGNISVSRAGSSTATGSGPETLILGPLVVGPTTTSITIRAFGADQRPVSGIPLTLTNGLATLSLVTGADGVVSIAVGALTASGEWIASSGAATSNAIVIDR